MDAKRGDIGTTAARQAVALFDALGADAVTVNPYLGGEAIAPLLERLDRFAYVLCRTSNPGAGELQALVVARPATTRRPGRAAVRPGRPAGGGVGPGRNRRARRRGDGARGAGRDPGDRAGAARSSCRASERRAARSGRCSRDGPATAAPAGGRPGGGLLVNVSRGIAGARAADGVRRSGRGDGGGRPRVGCPAPRATLGAASAIRRAVGSTLPKREVHSDTMPFNIGAPELIVILVIALLVIGPGKLPDVGVGARQEHPRVPQGVLRRAGRDEGRHVADPRRRRQHAPTRSPTADPPNEPTTESRSARPTAREPRRDD